MTEESVREKDVSEEEQGSVSLRERFEGMSRNIRERCARGGFLLLSGLFAGGILFGVAAKTLSARSVTMGYLDYTVSAKDISAVDLNAVQRKLVSKQEEEAKRQKEEMKKAQEEMESKLPPLPPTPEPPALPEEE